MEIGNARKGTHQMTTSDDIHYHYFQFGEDLETGLISYISFINVIRIILNIRLWLGLWHICNSTITIAMGKEINNQKF